MSIFRYGLPHMWFAWRPVETVDQGWAWLRWLIRQKVYVDGPGGPFWEYFPQDDPRFKFDEE